MMFSKLMLLNFSVLAFTSTFLGCNSGSIEGIVRNPFDNKPVPKAYVYIQGTSQIDTTDENGQYVLAGVKADTYKVTVKKHTYSKSENFTKVKPDAAVTQLDLYIYPTDKDLKPGLYLVNDSTTEKVLNQWINFEVDCEDGIVAYKTSERMNNINSRLPAPLIVENGKRFFYHYGSNGNPLSVKIEKMRKLSQSLIPKACKNVNTPSAWVNETNTTVKMDLDYVSEDLWGFVPENIRGVALISIFEGQKKLVSYFANFSN